MIDKEKIQKAAAVYGKRTLSPVDSACGFIEGVFWFLNSLWHDASQEPPNHSRLLIKFQYPSMKRPSYTVAWHHTDVKSWTGLVEENAVISWCDIGDLGVDTEGGINGR